MSSGILLRTHGGRAAGILLLIPALCFGDSPAASLMYFNGKPETLKVVFYPKEAATSEIRQAAENSLTDDTFSDSEYVRFENDHAGTLTFNQSDGTCAVVDFSPDGNRIALTEHQAKTRKPIEPMRVLLYTFDLKEQRAVYMTGFDIR